MQIGEHTIVHQMLNAIRRGRLIGFRIKRWKLSKVEIKRLERETGLHFCDQAYCLGAPIMQTD